ncbi:hypothetical protein PCK1_002762 [Pneumocystis canis]|nr:hypothetical protein PCK1_002762 [Pneumocystis canis]
MRKIVFQMLFFYKILFIQSIYAEYKSYSSLNLKSEGILADIEGENRPFLPMLETLQLLSRKPSCFRSTISSLLSTCEKSDSDLHEDEKLVFAVKLTLCELDTAHIEIPEICRQESSRQCVKELEKRPQWWTSYSGYFRDITRICFYARTEVEKDQLLAIHRNLTYAQMGLLRNLKLEMDDIDLRLYEKYKMEQSWQKFQENMQHSMLLMQNEIKKMEKVIKNGLHGVEKIIENSIVNRLNKIRLSLDFSFGSIEGLLQKISYTSTVTDSLSKTLKNLTFSHNNLFSSLSSIEALQLKIGNGSLSTIKSISNLVNKRMDNLLDQIQELKNTTKNAENYIYSWIFSKIPLLFVCLIFLFFPMYRFAGTFLVISLYYLWKKSMVFIGHLNILNFSSLLYILSNIYSNVISFLAFLTFVFFFVYVFKKGYRKYNHRIPFFYRFYFRVFKTNQDTNRLRLSTINRTDRDSQLETELSSTFPPPPQHYKLFTDENLRAFETNQYGKIRDTCFSDISGAANIQDSTLAMFFTPPKIPTKGSYQCFHEYWKIPDELPSLTEFGIPQLFDTTNGPLNAQERIAELKKMLKSLLLNFLELVGIMGIAPEQFVEKVEHIRILLLNMHHLINEYRPHQARHTLCCLVEKQVENEKKKLLDCQYTCNYIKNILFMYKRILDPKPHKDSQNKSEVKLDSQVHDLRIWSVIDQKIHIPTHLIQPFDSSVVL